MIHAYNENYLNNSTRSFAIMLDAAVNLYGYAGVQYIQMFLMTNICKQYETGNPKYVAGKSGSELFYDVILQASGHEIDLVPYIQINRSAEYWIGYAISYYQWHSGKSFADIFRYITFSDLIHMYPTLHEADITKFIATVDAIIEKNNFFTNLKKIRTAAGLSQRQLSRCTGVNIRSIQMYEQKNKDINKANALALLAISKTLGCRIEDLME